MYAAVAGEVDGVRLISPQRLREATSVMASGIDEIFGNPSWWGLGYSIGRPGRTAPDTPTTFGMGGHRDGAAPAAADRRRPPALARLIHGDGLEWLAGQTHLNPFPAGLRLRHHL
jgi:hypothetical protein